jgi:branched-chain amino acid transport system permease protein
MSLDELALQALNGLSFGALLFLLASGFTLVFGLMKIVNLAHGAFYLVGGYVGIATFTATRNFLAAILAGAATAAVFGLASERLLLRRVRGQELPEVLLTVGIALVIADGCLAVFGGNPRSLPIPGLLAGSVQLGGFAYPSYRLFVIVLAAVVGVVLYVVQHRTRVGALIRAGVDDREIAEAMGINVPRVFTAMFVFGGALAGLAGVVAALVVVVIGGLGSLQGAAVGSVLIGLVDAFSKVWVPELSYFAVFAPMAIVLMFRPAGLFSRSRA